MTQLDRVGEETCDLCHHAGAVELAEHSVHHNRIVVCTRCRLIYSWPRPTVEELERHYRDEFRGDAGSQRRVEENPEMLDADIERQRVKWPLDIVNRAADLHGKDVLDLRSRGGALAYEMQKLGANVTPVDPFHANVEQAKKLRGLTNATCLPMSQFHNLPFPDDSFDVITALTIHVPGHVVCASAFFAEMRRLLRSEGKLLIDEKDVLMPRRFNMPSLLDTGHAHIYHFTQRTLRLYLEQAGFDVLECEIDRERKTGSRHIRAIAQKRATCEVRGCWTDGPSVNEIKRRIWWSTQRWRMRQVKNTLLRRNRRQAA